MRTSRTVLTPRTIRTKTDCLGNRIQKLSVICSDGERGSNGECGGDGETVRICSACATHHTYGAIAVFFMAANRAIDFLLENVRFSTPNGNSGGRLCTPE